MILEAFEKVLASKWGEFLVPEMEEEGNNPEIHPVAMAFMALEQSSDDIRDGEVAITPRLEKHWRVLEQEYSISRRAAEVLMILARKYPSVVRIRGNDSKVTSIGFRWFESGLEELTDAGVLDKTEEEGLVEYELSHDLLASAVFGKNFTELWKETQGLRATRRLLEAYETSDGTDDGQPT